MQIDFNSEKSIFLQIAQMIEDDILKDIIKEDEKVLSTNEIAKLYNINPNTAAKGISILSNSEIIYKKRGVGMFVAAGAKDMILQKRKKDFAKEFLVPLLKEAKNLGISTQELQKLISEENL